MARLVRQHVPAGRLTVLPRSVDTAILTPGLVRSERVAAQRRAWGVLPNFRIVCTPGRIEPRNGQLALVDAARLLTGGGRQSQAAVTR